MVLVERFIGCQGRIERHQKVNENEAVAAASFFFTGR